MPRPGISTPVLVLNTGHHGGLGVARSLGSMGVPVHLVDAKRRDPASTSRYCRSHSQWDFDSATTEESIDFLLQSARRLGGRPLLLPTSDHTTLFLVANAERLKPEFLFPDQPEETVRALTNKASLFHLAKSHGIPTPETFFPQSKNDLADFLEAATFPLMLKAIDYGLLGPEVQPKSIVSDRSELLLQYDRMQGPHQPNLVIQEYIPGGEDSSWIFNGYFDQRSECLFGMTGKKIRQCPVFTGVASLAVCLRNDAVREMTLRWMKAIAYKGILDLGYRYDRRDGQYKVFDVNPRLGCTFRLFVGDNGMDVARAWYLDLTGQDVPSANVPEGRKWIVEDYDVVSALRHIRSGNLTLGNWLRSLRGVREAAVFSLKDPLPGFSILAQDATELAGRLGRRGKPPGRERQPSAPGCLSGGQLEDRR